MRMMDRPIVIITFEGIIGHFHKERIWCDKNFKLITRGNCSSGLRLFCNYFQVVLFIQKNIKKNILKIKDWLKVKGVFVDAIYCRKTISDSVEEDYTQIYNDFNIVSSKNISKSIIVINSVDIDNPVISNNAQLEKVLFNKTEGKLVSGLPYTIGSHPEIENDNMTIESLAKFKSMLNMPLSILIPNILSDNGDDISMVAIFKIVIAIAFLSLKDYTENFKYSNLKLLKESDVKLQTQFLGLDLTNVCQRSNS